MEWSYGGDSANGDSAPATLRWYRSFEWYFHILIVIDVCLYIKCIFIRLEHVLPMGPRGISCCWATYAPVACLHSVKILFSRFSHALSTRPSSSWRHLVARAETVPMGYDKVNFDDLMTTARYCWSARVPASVHD